MIISAIVAMGKNRVIGKNNTMMWSIPSEYSHYQKVISGHYYILGRKNYEGSKEVHEGQPALVLSRQENLTLERPVYNNIESAIKFARDKGEQELFVIGGAEVYRLSMPYLHRLYLSIVDFESEGDTYFPKHEDFNWKEVESRYYELGESTPKAWNFRLLEKTPSKSIDN